METDHMRGETPLSHRSFGFPGGTGLQTPPRSPLDPGRTQRCRSQIVIPGLSRDDVQRVQRRSARIMRRAVTPCQTIERRRGRIAPTPSRWVLAAP
jgi:hypothetical protein